MYKVSARVEQVKGECPVYEVGDEMEFEGVQVRTIKGKGLCAYALSALLPIALQYRHRLVEPTWLNAKHHILACPDPGPAMGGSGNVIFRLTRTETDEVA